MTDSLVLVCFALFAFNGWRKGFLRSAAGPLSLIIGIVLASYYYFQEKNVITAFAISIISPILINWALTFTIIFFTKPGKDKPAISKISRLSGSLLSLFWSGTILILTLLVVTMIPLHVPWLKNIQAKIIHSKTYAALNSGTDKKRLINAYDIESASLSLQDPEKMKALQESPHYKKVIANEKIKKLYSDENLMKDIEDKNFTKILSDPRLQEILHDPELLKELLALNQEIINDTQTPPTEEDTTDPH